MDSLQNWTVEKDKEFKSIKSCDSNELCIYCSDYTKCENAVFIIGNENNNIKIFNTADGYTIASYIRDREPQIVSTTYKNGTIFNHNTKWSVKMIILHGILEESGAITPLQK